ncbi:unnamed protein product [Ascophyllum nodosum]
MFIFRVQLTTSRIDNLTRLIHTLLCVVTIHIYLYSTRVCSNLEPCQLVLLVVPVSYGNLRSRFTQDLGRNRASRCAPACVFFWRYMFDSPPRVLALDQKFRSSELHNLPRASLLPSTKYSTELSFQYEA